MLITIMACVLLLGLTTLVHYEALRNMYLLLPKMPMANRPKLLIVVFGVFAVHFVEIIMYGLSFYYLETFFHLGTTTGQGQLTLLNCLYFSAETYTTLGFGDIEPFGDLRLLAGVEALNGLVLVGWSASFVYIEMQRFWRSDSSHH